MSEYILEAYADLEISTQIVIREALARKIRVEILDRKENFIRLSKDRKTEYVKEASKTSLDSYISFLIMENKSVSKLVLAEGGISVPSGKSYDTISNALEDYSLYQSKKVAIKPVTTNFGTGVFIKEENSNFENFKYYVETAFSYSSSIIIEDFIRGEEYRFLVLGEECVAVCKRVPANVKGDGKSNIIELIDKKNQDPRRGKGHVTPLEKIQLGEVEMENLISLGYCASSIPEDGETIFLRKNSNISTGGDSIDFTDEMHPSYKEIAIKASRLVSAKICGVDIIIENIDEKASPLNHGILEVNFNPVLYIHEYPYIGKSRGIGKKILDLLGF
ncbi:MAG: bifunctional glutamate--cysteine ligase GshA/glutathione synthetase GshB [Leptospiraceae bacterium]|nr:bifunctional glutamate--cysteine ligase GshA/glutathione synthetase GshB [Leptospiraceae bacterium]MCP5499180.1 bifunctional glutamate--cysteine ligase GshA/glutathione synthetase GshB [Leptospiraceae bacterium]